MLSKKALPPLVSPDHPLALQPREFLVPPSSRITSRLQVTGYERRFMSSASGTRCKLRAWTSARRVRTLEIPLLSTVRSFRAISTDSSSVNLPFNTERKRADAGAQILRLLPRSLQAPMRVTMPTRRSDRSPTTSRDRDCTKR